MQGRRRAGWGVGKLGRRATGQVGGLGSGRGRKGSAGSTGLRVPRGRRWRGEEGPEAESRAHVQGGKRGSSDDNASGRGEGQPLCWGGGAGRRIHTDDPVTHFDSASLGVLLPVPLLGVSQ